VDDLAAALAAVEAGIDFTDQEDVRTIDRDDLLDRLRHIERQLHDTLKASRQARPFDALPAVVLVGPPSTGKSTLFNALLNQQRSVISAQPGTTRDIIAEPLWLESQGRRTQVMLTDIAGLDHPAGALDHQVQAAARQAIAQADLILALGDDARPAPSLSAIARCPILQIHSKADLPASRPIHPDELPVIAAQGKGLDTLKLSVLDHLGQQPTSLSSQLLALEPRHDRSFTLAMDHLHTAMSLLASQYGEQGVDHPELIAGDMRLALDELAALGGQMTPDDVIGKVFATFCVGK
jgi:tRNA modification GTPase